VISAALLAELLVGTWSSRPPSVGV